MSKASNYTVAVVTSTIGRLLLEETIQSVMNQTYPAKHYVFVHGKEFWEKAKVILDKYPQVEALYLPNNNGADGYGMAPVFAMAGWVVSEDVVCYLDDDNWYEPNHIETAISLMGRKDLDWVFSLRQIVDFDGTHLVDDNCDSLGYYQNTGGVNLVDNSCFVVKTKYARNLGAAWYAKGVSDRSFLNALFTFKLLGGCTGLRTTNYRLSKDGSNTITKESIEQCNKIMEERYPDGFPWVKESHMKIGEINAGN
jgi:glycosyltransferase involved in cell wall biosynthesis